MQLKSILLSLVIILLSIGKLFCQKNNFTGSIKYNLTYQKGGRLKEGASLKITFADSIIKRLYSDSTYELYDLYKSLMTTTFGGQVKKIPLINSGKIDQKDLASDTTIILGYNCEKNIITYTLEEPIKTICKYELYLSPMSFIVPHSFLFFDVYFNNSFGRIPLKIKQVNTYNNKTNEFEWTAVSIEKM